VIQVRSQAAPVAASYRDDGTPGEPLIYHAGYNDAYVPDPDGNSVEASPTTARSTDR
jgi:hypothetical protein